MTVLPAPLVPAEVDLTQLDGFMLNAERLLGSELMALATGDEFKAAVTLWCRAWKQIPAASLPDNEKILAKFSGLSVSAWRKVAVMALRGFIKCSDGRLYHKVLANDALKAWAKRQDYIVRRAQDKERLTRWRKGRGQSEAEWEATRALVFQRDSFRCRKCGGSNDLHCDHIIEVSAGGGSELENLMTLCRSCHSKKTADRKHEMHGEMHFTRENAEPEMHGEMRKTGTGTGTGTKKERISDPNGSDSAAGATPYAFSGKIIRLTLADLDQWRRSYNAIPDIRAALTTLDDFYDGELRGKDRKDWFRRCSSALGKKHQAALLDAKRSATSPMAGRAVI